MMNMHLHIALADCNEAQRNAPDDAETLESRCFVRYRQGDFANAIADCDGALRLQANSASALYVRGLAKLKAGVSVSGNADIARATQIDPKIADTYAGYGVKP
jgi:tetratricopeptide (TPR) repeat protein